MLFKNRSEAGQQLAEQLIQYKDNPRVVVLGLPRGGVVVAFKIAKTLNLPLDLVVPRKIGAPGNPEFAIGAITEDGEGIFDEQVISTYNISKDYIDQTVAKEKKEAQRRLELYRGDRPPLDLKNKIAILVDDGVATGSTMLAAVKSTRSKGVKKIIVAIPVTARDSLEKIKEQADEVVYLNAPLFFGAVGAFYQNFDQTNDKEVIEIMNRAQNADNNF